MKKNKGPSYYTEKTKVRCNRGGTRLDGVPVRVLPTNNESCVLDPASFLPYSRANPSTFHVIQEDDSDSESDDDDDDDDDESDEDSEDDLGGLTYFCRYGSIYVTELFPLFLLYFSLT